MLARRVDTTLASRASRRASKNGRVIHVPDTTSMASLVNCGLALLQCLFMPFVIVWACVSGVLYNLTSCCSHPPLKAKQQSQPLPSRVSAWCCTFPQGAATECVNVSEMALKLQSEDDDEDEYMKFVGSCFGMCEVLGWLLTIPLSLPGCLIYTGRQVVAKRDPLTEANSNGNSCDVPSVNASERKAASSDGAGGDANV